MPLPWKKTKSSRISRFVSDFQQSPKHGGSLVVETGFPTSLIDLFVKNRDRLQKKSSKRNNNNNKTQPIHSIPTKKRVSSSPPPPLQRHKSLPVKLDDPSSVTDSPPIEELVVDNNNNNNVGVVVGDGLTKSEDENVRNGGSGCVLMVVAVKVFVVAVLALSTKRLVVGITLSAFSLIFLEFAVARVFTLLNLCPHARIRLCSFIFKKKPQEELLPERKCKVTFEITEELKDYNEESQDSLEKSKLVEEEEEEKEVETIRDIVFKKEKSKSSKLKSKIVKKIVPKKLRSYKKKKKMKSKEEEIEVIEVIGEDGEYCEEESVTEVSSLFSDDRIGSEISEIDEVNSNPALLEEIIEEEETRARGDITKAMVLIVIVLAGLLYGKVLAICLTLSSCLILRLVCNNKTQTSV